MGIRTAASGEAGGIVTGWLVRLVVVLGLTGVLAFDGVSLGVATLSVTDQAASAARAAANEYVMSSSAQGAYERAVGVARRADPDNQVPVESFLITTDGQVTLTVQRSVPTLVLRHVPGSERWLLADATTTHTAG